MSQQVKLRLALAHKCALTQGSCVISSLDFAKAHKIVALTAALSGAVFLGVTSAYAQTSGGTAIVPGGTTGGTTGGNPSTGGGQPGQMVSSSGTNTANGNKLHTIPVVGWTARGGLPVSLSLYNNSQGTGTSELGKGWTHTFDIYLVVDPTTQNATMLWGNGTSHAYTYSSGSYTAPTGVYDTLTTTTSGSTVTSYTLTTKAGVKFLFAAATGNRWRCASITDRNSNSLSFVYNTSDFVTSVTDPTGRALTFTYNSSNQLTKVTDPMSRDYNFTYNTAGDLSQVTYPTAGSTTPTIGFGYDTNRRVSSITDPRGNATTYSYDSSGALQWEKDALLHQTSYVYGSGYTDITDARGFTTRDTYSGGLHISHVDELSKTTAFHYATGTVNIDKTTDALGKEWNYTYDSRGNVLTAQNPLGNTTTFTYDATVDKIKTATTPGSRTTTYNYDAYGNLLSVTNPLSQTNTFTYDSWGQMLSATNALSQSTTFSYDSNGYVASITDPLSHSKTFTYDAMGHRLTATKGTRTATNVYDSLGRVTSSTPPLDSVTYPYASQRTTSYTYDAAGNVISKTTPQAGLNTYTYDAVNRLTSRTDALSRTTGYGYDATGNKTSFTDGRGKVTTYAYNGRGQLSGVSYPDSTGESYTYDNAGKQLTKTDGRGIVTTFSYDDAGQVIGKSYSGGSAPSVAFAYDIDGRQASMTDGTGTTTYTYDNAGRMLTRTSPQGGVTYTYDAAGRKLSQTSGGVTTSYGYDAAGRLTSSTTGSAVTTYGYTALDELQTISYPNGTQVYHDIAGNTGETLVTFISDGTNLLNQYNYQYQASSSRLVNASFNSGGQTVYAYDAVGQLTAEYNYFYNIGYTYDNAGNRATRTYTPSGGTTTTEYYTYDDANKLLSVGSTPTTVDRSYTYDNAGNVTSVTNGTLVTSLNWDGANRLTGITYPSSATNTFAYNGLDQRIGKADSTGTFPFTLADDAINSPVLADGAATYQFGLGLESEVRGGSTRFYHPDIIGTTRTTSNASAAVSSTLETDAFGNTWTPGTSGTQSPFGYAGQHGYQTDADSGLMRVGYRYYDALSGRFISRDPIQDGNNWYAYCNNDPVNNVDPNGLQIPDSSLADPRALELLAGDSGEACLGADLGAVDGTVIPATGPASPPLPPGLTTIGGAPVETPAVTGLPVATPGFPGAPVTAPPVVTTPVTQPPLHWGVKAAIAVAAWVHGVTQNIAANAATAWIDAHKKKVGAAIAQTWKDICASQPDVPYTM